VKNLGQMMKQAQQMQQKMADMQSQLEAAEITGASGGGMVRVTLSGKGDLKALKIDPALLAEDEVEVLEDLIIAAHADARTRVEAYEGRNGQDHRRTVAAPRHQSAILMGAG